MSTQMVEQKTRRKAWAPVRDWHSRGYLPHCDEIGFVQNITFRLADSIPTGVIDRWRDELGIIPGLAAYDRRNIEIRRRIEKYEDAGHGYCRLRNPQLAELVQNALFFFDGERYRLLEWCVMPNHVHALVLPVNGHLPAKIVHSWKSYTGHVIKGLLDPTEPFWMADYHDRFIRDDRHLEIVRDYIRRNPVAAGLVLSAEDWKWSSAGHRRSAGHGSADGTSAESNEGIKC
jgi:REP element-mobilizing transposase RayT